MLKARRFRCHIDLIAEIEIAVLGERGQLLTFAYSFLASPYSVWRLLKDHTYVHKNVES